MCGRIGPHVTLIHDVVDHDRAAESVRRRPRRPPRSRSASPAPATGAGRPSACTSTSTTRRGPCSRCTRNWPTWRSRGWARVPFRPHCTLVHSRTTAPGVAGEAWAALDAFAGGWDVEVTAIDIIELDEATGWTTVERCALSPTLVTD